jgi:hypothetical protein
VGVDRPAPRHQAFPGDRTAVCQSSSHPVPLVRRRRRHSKWGRPTRCRPRANHPGAPRGRTTTSSGAAWRAIAGRTPRGAWPGSATADATRASG